MLAAATMNCPHQCPLCDGDKPHVGFEITQGDETVIIENQSAACAGHTLRCNSSAIPVIQSGSKTVYIGHKQAGRQTDPTSHGGIILKGASSVFIGD